MIPMARPGNETDVSLTVVKGVLLAMVELLATGAVASATTIEGFSADVELGDCVTITVLETVTVIVDERRDRDEVEIRGCTIVATVSGSGIGIYEGWLMSAKKLANALEIILEWSNSPER